MRPWFRWGALALAAAGMVQPAAAAIRVEVVRGEGANNNAALGAAVSPAVRVTDASGKPLSDALVVFEAPSSGPTVDFGGSGPSAHGISSETGVVVAPAARPASGDGPLEIRVTASLGGEFANAVIHQINLGVNGASARSQELDIVALPREAPAGKNPPRFGVQVLDAGGQPVPWANVTLVLQRISPAGKIEELDRQQGPSGDKGELSGQFAKMNAAGNLEFMARAEFNGRRATRYFKLK